MHNRLLIGILGHQNSGKSHTWNILFGRRVQTGSKVRKLELRPGESVGTFLISGSPEERGKYVDKILTNKDCRIVLCSMQYRNDVRATLNYFIDNDFFLYIQWLNPGFKDPESVQDYLKLKDEVLLAQSTFSVRNGKIDASPRVREIRELFMAGQSFVTLSIICDRTLSILCPYKYFHTKAERRRQHGGLEFCVVFPARLKGDQIAPS